MSKRDFQQSTYAIATFMQQAADEIAAGKAQGVKILYPKADRRTTHLDRWRLQLLKRRA